MSLRFRVGEKMLLRDGLFFLLSLRDRDGVGRVVVFEVGFI